MVLLSVAFVALENWCLLSNIFPFYSARSTTSESRKDSHATDKPLQILSRRLRKAALASKSENGDYDMGGTPKVIGI